MARVSPHFAKDAMVSDGVCAQEENGHERTPEAVGDLAASILAGLDRKHADSKQVTFSKPSPENALGSLGPNDIKFSSLKERPEAPQPGEIRAKYLTYDKAAQLMAERVRLLASRPEWSALLATINPLATNGTLGEAKRMEAERAYIRIIKASVKAFGPLDKPKPLVFGYGS